MWEKIWHRSTHFERGLSHLINHLFEQNTEQNSTHRVKHFSTHYIKHFSTHRVKHFSTHCITAQRTTHSQAIFNSKPKLSNLSIHTLWFVFKSSLYRPTDFSNTKTAETAQASHRKIAWIAFALCPNCQMYLSKLPNVFVQISVVDGSWQDLLRNPRGEPRTWCISRISLSQQIKTNLGEKK